MRRPPVAREPTGVRCEQDDVDRARSRADVLLVLLEVAAERSRRDHESRRAPELRRFGGAGGLLQQLHRLRTENTKAPGIGAVMVRRPARELE